MSSDMCSHGRCENFMGGYECICDPGYESNRQRTSCAGESIDTKSMPSTPVAHID